MATPQRQHLYSNRHGYVTPNPTSSAEHDEQHYGHGQHKNEGQSSGSCFSKSENRRSRLLPIDRSDLHGVTTIGRSRSCTYVIKSQLVSRLHATCQLLSRHVVRITCIGYNGINVGTVKLDSNEQLDIVLERGGRSLELDIVGHRILIMREAETPEPLTPPSQVSSAPFNQNVTYSRMVPPSSMFDSEEVDSSMTGSRKTTSNVTMGTRNQLKDVLQLPSSPPAIWTGQLLTPLSKETASKMVKPSRESDHHLRSPVSSELSKEERFESSFSPKTEEKLVRSLVFSRLAATPISELASICPEIPTSIFEEQLRIMPFVGEVRRQGKDAAGRPLQSEYYYLLDQDPDLERRERYRSFIKPTRSCRKTHKQYYWKKIKLPHKVHSSGGHSINHSGHDNIEHSRKKRHSLRAKSYN